MLHIQENNGEFECSIAGATGSPVCGRGLTVAEAVGDWTIQSGEHVVVCEEMRYWGSYKAEDIGKFLPIGRRS